MARPESPEADPYGFDTVDLEWLRTKSGAKWHQHQHQHPELLSAWVADMDFLPPPVALAALRARVQTADFGYPDWGYPNPKSPVCGLFAERAAQRYGWHFDSTEVREFCEVVQAVQVSLHLATQPGDAVVLHTPSYPPLWKSLAHMGRHQIDVPAHVDAAGVHFDYDELEATLSVTPAKALLLCHPHNPTGHRFALDELARLVEIAERFDLLIISDEIHADLTYDAVHVPIASLGDAASRTITIHSAAKAFNLAGMRHAVAHVGPPALRAAIDALPDHLLGAINLFAADATEAVWRNGDDWLTAVMAHLERNRDRFAAAITSQLPDVRHRPPDATYLAWLDCRGLGWGDSPVDVFHDAGLVLSDGNDFGPLGAGHVRVNFATSTAIVDLMVASMVAAVR